MLNRRLIAVLFTLALFCFFAVPQAHAQSDIDGDGVEDGADLCPNEDGSFLDVDGDGCIDVTANPRHLEYWAPGDLPFTYLIHEPAAPGVFDGSDFVALIDAFEAWAAIPDAVLSATYGGTTPDGNASGMDGLNTITFEDQDFLAVYGSAVLAVGVTTSLTEPGEFLGTPVRAGQIVDADMIFNPIRNFATDSEGSGTDLLSVATHEAGHLFGFAHSSVVTSTMFPALPPGTTARTLETEDQVLAFMGYPEEGALAAATSLSGQLSDGATLDPIGGAAVFAIATATGDTLGSQYTFADGTYLFAGLPEGEYYVAVSPLGGGNSNGVVPGLINAYVDSIATNLLWNPEFWDLGESADDGDLSKDAVTVNSGAAVTGIDIITNVDADPPVLQTVAPNGGELVRADAVFFIEFDEAIDFESAGVAIKLREEILGSFEGIGFGLLQVSSDNVVIVDPAGLMTYGAQYELEIGPGLKDRFGNPTTTTTVISFQVEAAPPLTISTVSPTLASGGVVAVIYGQGFDLTSPANNLVDFGGTVVPALTAGPNSLSVMVPDDLPVGPVPLSVSTPGNTSNIISISGVESNDFVKGTDYASVPLASDPEAVALLPGAEFSYVATSTGVVAVASGFANPNFGSSELIGYAAGTTDLAVSPDGNRVYAVSRDGKSILVINSDFGDVAFPNATFNTVIAELQTVGSPVGVAVDGAGERLYVATASGIVEVWDVELGSGTYHRSVAQLVSPTPSLQGAIAVDRTGLRVLALTGTGELLIWDASAPTAPPLVTPIAVSPRDITIEPQGTVAYVTDGAGTVSVVLLTSGVVSQTISVGGEPYALALTPSGLRGYVANRAGDDLPAIDFNPASPAFRTVTNALPAGQQPVDVVASPDADYLLVAEQGLQTLRIVGIRQGPEITNIEPRWVRPGDLVTITGSGFVGMHPDTANPSSNRVYFGSSSGILTTYANFNSLFVRVPDDFTGGSVRVGVSGAAVAGQPTELFSNPVTLRTLEATTPVTDSPATAVFLADSQGYPWQGVGVEATVAASPDGRFIITIGLSNSAYLINSDPASPDRGQVIGEIPLNATPRAGRLVVAPDGNHAYYSSTSNGIHILDTDPESPSYLTEVGTVVWTLVDPDTGSPDILAITPSGEYLVASDELNDQLILVDLRPDSEVYHETVLQSGGFGYTTGMAIHPSGLMVYCAATTGSIHVISLDNVRQGFFQEAYVFDNTSAPEDVIFTPDGDRCFVLSRPGGPSGDHYLEYIDSSIPDFPVSVDDPQVLLAGSQQVRGRMFMLANGDRMVVDLPGNGETFWLDITPGVSPGPVFRDLGSLNINGTSSVISIAMQDDGNGFWSASRGDTGIHYVNLVAALKTAPISGQGQTGVAGQPLAAPLVYFVDDGDAFTAVGGVAEVRVTGGGGSLGNGSDYQWVTVDQNGNLTVDWTMGPTPDSGPPANSLAISFNAGATIADGITVPSVADPGSQPLSQVQVLPATLAAEISLTSTVQVTFSRAVDPATIIPANLTLRRQSDGTPVEVAYGFSAGNSRVSMVPLAALEPSTVFEIVTTAAILDSGGGALTNPTVTTFTTRAPPPLALTTLSPPAATVGTQIVISGTGFAGTASANLVRFGAVSAPASSIGPGYITVFVPLGAPSGDVTVVANSQTSNPKPFNVLVPETAPLDEIFSTVETGISVQSVAVTPDGSKAYTVSTETNQVLPIDLSTFTNLDPIPVGSAPQGVVIHPNGGTAYVTNFSSGTVSVIDTAADEVIETITVGANPVELVASPIGDRLYVVNQLDQTLSVIDIDVSSAGYHTVVATAPTTKSTRGAAIRPDGSVLYLGTADGFLTIELEQTSFGVVATVPTTKSTKGTAITPDGSLLILLTTTNEVLIVDVSEGGGNAVVATVPATKTTKGAAITPDGTGLYLLQEDTDEILVVALVIESSVGTYSAVAPLVVNPVVVKTIPVDPSPGVIAFDPSGSGLGIIAHQRSNGQLSFLNASSIPRGELDALVDVRELELDGVEQVRSLYIKVYVELPAGVDPHGVDLASVRLNGSFEPVIDQTTFEDSDSNGTEELVLRFDRRELRDFLPVTDMVDVIISGVVAPQGSTFAGKDVISTIWPSVTWPVESTIFVGGQNALITWETPPGLDVGCVDIWWTATGGEYWAGIAYGLENTGEYLWSVPAIFSPNSIIEVTLYDHGDGTHNHDSKNLVGLALSPNFAVKDRAVPVLMQEVSLAASDGAGRIEWGVSYSGALDGFNVLRAESKEGPYQQVSLDPVRPFGTVEGLKFEFVDDSIFANRDYYYLLTEVREDGQGFQHGPYELNWSLENALFQNRPNTFNPRTSISFNLAQDGRARLAVYDVRGRLVDVIVDEELRADTHSYVWDGTDRSGRSVASGVYIYRLTTSDGFAAAKKMTLVR